MSESKNEEKKDEQVIKVQKEEKNSEQSDQDFEKGLSDKIKDGDKK